MERFQDLEELASLMREETRAMIERRSARIKAGAVRWRRSNSRKVDTSSAVVEGLEEQTGELLAVYQSSFEYQEAAEEKAILDHLDFLSLLQHPNVIRVVGWSNADGRVYMLRELCACGNVEGLLTNFTDLKWKPVHEAFVRRFFSSVLFYFPFSHHRVNF